MTYADLKILLVDYLGLEQDALHIHGAILLYILAMFAFRQTRKSRFPWLFVLAAELANESYDLLHQHNLGEPLRWGESLKDLWNTMLWPSVLLLVGRYTNVFQHRDAADCAGPRP
jgi:cell shape-determining protein MreD